MQCTSLRNFSAPTLIYGNFMIYSDKQNIGSNMKLHHATIKTILANIPTHSMSFGIRQHKNQLVEVPSHIYHKQTKELLFKNDFSSPKEKTLFVITRVAQELWTNFYVQGRDTAMLRHLHSVLRTEYGRDLQFIYPHESTELIIMSKIENGMKPIIHEEQIEMIDKAWQVSQDVVYKYTL